jgi:hypothetical protein
MGEPEKKASNKIILGPVVPKNFSLLISRNRSRTNLCIAAPESCRIKKNEKGSNPIPACCVKRKKPGVRKPPADGYHINTLFLHFPFWKKTWITSYA